MNGNDGKPFASWEQWSISFTPRTFPFWVLSKNVGCLPAMWQVLHFTIYLFPHLICMRGQKYLFNIWAPQWDFQRWCCFRVEVWWKCYASPSPLPLNLSLQLSDTMKQIFFLSHLLICSLKKYLFDIILVTLPETKPITNFFSITTCWSSHF